MVHKKLSVTHHSQVTSKGFTLIEILLVIGLIAILAAIVIVAINPARQFQQARDATRWSDVNTILNAVHQYTVDNNGTFPTAITTNQYEICKTSVAPSTCTSSSLVDLSVLTSGELYLVSIPIDPSCPLPNEGCGGPNDTGYTIYLTAGSRVTVEANEAEDDTISVTR